MLNAKFFNELSTLELYEILKSRSEIFVPEQKIDHIDEDNTDYDSLHCFFWENGSWIYHCLRRIPRRRCSSCWHGNAALILCKVLNLEKTLDFCKALWYNVIVVRNDLKSLICLLGCRQAVRHLTLTQAFPGFESLHPNHEKSSVPVGTELFCSPVKL